MLHTIWIISLVLFFLSLAVMGGLLLLRWVRQRRELKDAAVRSELSRQMVIWRLQPDRATTQLKRATRRNPSQVADILIHALELVQGDDQARLVQLGQALGLDNFLLDQLTSSRPLQRLEAAEKLAFFHTRNVIQALSLSLKDSYPPLRLAAARALAGFDSDVPAHVLRDAAWGDSVLVDDLFETLANRQSQDLVELAQDEHVAVHRRVSAVNALAGTGGYALLPVFSSLAEHNAPALRAAAAKALGLLGHPKAEPMLAKLLGDSEHQVRVAAAQAAGAIQLVNLYERLVSMLDDEQWWVRLAAAEALAKGGQQGRKQLQAACSADSENVRSMAQVVLLEYGEVNG